MNSVTLKGNPTNIVGLLPSVGESAPAFTLIAKDFSSVTLDSYKGTSLVLSIFPSIDTDTCAASVQRFNQEATSLNGTKVLCISRDLPFAQSRFCAAEEANNVVMLSDYVNGQFGKDYGVEIIQPPLLGLHARAVVVIDNQGKVVYTELVSEITAEPNYQEAIKALQSL